MEVLDTVRPEEVTKPDPMEEVNQKLAEASRSMALSLSQAVDAINLWSRTVLAPALEEVSREFQRIAEAFKESGIDILDLLRKAEEERDLVEKARGYGLDGRVISLCGHRKAKVRKKNLNRLRKEVQRYERSRGKAGGQGASKPGHGYTRNRQPDEVVSGEAGDTEPNG